MSEGDTDILEKTTMWLGVELKMSVVSPGWCGSMVRVLACTQKCHGMYLGCRFESRPQSGEVWETTN